MGRLAQYLSQIRLQLKGLTISQRLLLGMVVVVMIGTIFFVVQFSRKPEMITLLPQAATPEEINTMVASIKGKYPYEVQGDKIMVPVEQAYEIRGYLADAQALPRDTTVAFARLAEESDFLWTSDSAERRWNLAKQEVLARVIGNFPYVQQATVFISRGQQMGLGRPAEPSSASISLRLKGSEGLSSAQVLAIVDLVRGAVSGLSRENIHLTDGGRIYNVPAEDAIIPADLLNFKKMQESEYTLKLKEFFSYLGDVKVAVNVIPDMSSRTINSEKYDPKAVRAATVEESKDTSTTDGAGAGGQPGVQPNVAAVAATPAGHSSNASTNDSNVHSEVRFPMTSELQKVPAGTEIKKLTASLSVPRSYFQTVFRHNAKDEKAEPTDEQLQPLIDTTLKRLQPQVKLAIGIGADDEVRVDWFDDTIVPHMAASGPAAVGILQGAGSVGSMVTLYAKQTVLGAIALGGLMMMLMMVRKAAPGAAGADADAAAFLGMGGGKGRGRNNSDPDSLDVGDDVIGEANQGEAVLTGIELDDETLASRKMVDEVSTMIKDNPENAATLVKRWMTKGK